jgi:SAM-dependent methyltransferase
MDSLDIQMGYWNGAGAAKNFSHPVPLPELRALVGPQAAILDYGCGYGRVTAELAQAGFARVVGVDASEALVSRGLREHPQLDLREVSAPPLPFPEASFDACLLVALLTCVPTDSGAEALLSEAHRLLKPGCLLFVSDYPLQKDQRNLTRYQEYEAQFGAYGVFRSGEAVFRHYRPARVDQLLSGFEALWRRELVVRTLNGNEADIFQVAARKRREGEEE